MPVFVIACAAWLAAAQEASKEETAAQFLDRVEARLLNAKTLSYTATIETRPDGKAASVATAEVRLKEANRFRVDVTGALDGFKVDHEFRCDGTTTWYESRTPKRTVKSVAPKTIARFVSLVQTRYCVSDSLDRLCQEPSRDDVALLEKSPAAAEFGKEEWVGKIKAKVVRTQIVLGGQTTAAQQVTLWIDPKTLDILKRATRLGIDAITETYSNLVVGGEIDDAEFQPAKKK